MDVLVAMTKKSRLRDRPVTSSPGGRARARHHRADAWNGRTTTEVDSARPSFHARASRPKSVSCLAPRARKAHPRGPEARQRDRHSLLRAPDARACAAHQQGRERVEDLPTLVAVHEHAGTRKRQRDAVTEHDVLGRHGHCTHACEREPAALLRRVPCACRRRGNRPARNPRDTESGHSARRPMRLDRKFPCFTDLGEQFVAAGTVLMYQLARVVTEPCARSRSPGAEHADDDVRPHGVEHEFRRMCAALRARDTAGRP